jgi:hypothetical protein
MAVNEYQPFLASQFASQHLIEGPTLRTEQYSSALDWNKRFDVLETIKDRLAHHDHSRTAAIRLIVHAVMLVPSKIPDIGQYNFQQTLLLCPLDYTAGKYTFKSLRKKSQQIYTHLSTAWAHARM